MSLNKNNKLSLNLCILLHKVLVSSKSVTKSRKESTVTKSRINCTFQIPSINDGFNLNLKESGMFLVVSIQSQYAPYDI